MNGLIGRLLTNGAFGLLLVAILCGRPGAGPATVRDADEKAVRALIDAYLASYAKGDAKSALSLWSRKSPEFAPRQREIERQFAQYSSLTFGTVKLSKLAFEGTPPTKASLRLEADVTATDARSGAKQKEAVVWVLSLVAEDGQWRLWRQSSPIDDLADALVAAPTAARRDALLKEHADLVGGELAKSLLDTGTDLDARSDRRGLEALRLAQQVADLTKNDSVAVDALLALGSAHHRAGEFGDAAVAYDEALRRLRARPTGDDITLARALLNVGLAHAHLGDNLKALRHTAEGLRIVEREKHDKGVGHASLTLGQIHESNRNYPAAMGAYRRAFDAFDRAGDAVGKGHAKNNMGVVALSMDGYELAAECYAEAMKIREAARDRRGVLNSRTNLAGLRLTVADREEAAGRTAVARKEREAALELYTECLAEARALGARWDEVVILGDMSVAQLGLGRPRAALESADAVTDVAARIGFPDGVWKGRALAGRAHRALGAPAAAHRAFDEAIETIERLRLLVGGEGDRQRFFEDKVVAYREKVALLVADGKAGEALAFAERAKGRTVLDVLRVGRFAVAGAMTPKERDDEQQLLGRLRTLNAQANGLRARLTAEEARGADAARVAPLKAAVQKFEAEREQAREAYQEFEQRLYAAHADLRVRRGAAPVFTLADADRLLTDGDTALLEFAVLEDLTFLFVVAKGAGGKAAVTVITLPVKRIELVDLVVGPVPKHRLTAAAIAAAKEAGAPAAAVQKLDLLKGTLKGRGLARDEMAKEVTAALGEARVYRDVVLAHTGGERRGGFRDQLASNNLDYDVAATKLYDLLLKPAKNQLAGKTKLVVVPDDVLWEIPFHALQSAPNRFLAEDASVALAPSLTILREMRRARDGRVGAGAGRPSLLALGNPEPGKPATPAEAPFEPLPHAAAELRELERLYGPDRARVFGGRDAREEVVKDQAGRHRVIHFATHGVLNNADPLFSYLLLSPPDGPVPKEDGFLEGWEVMKLDLRKSELAVLAACQTGRGRVGAGEGVVGMSWAFFVAGCPTTVVGNWSVRDDAAKDLMLAFHRHLAGDTQVPKAEALRQAQLEVMKRPDKKFRHPFYWAGFALVGDGR